MSQTIFPGTSANHSVTNNIFPGTSANHNVTSNIPWHFSQSQCHKQYSQALQPIRTSQCSPACQPIRMSQTIFPSISANQNITNNIPWYFSQSECKKQYSPALWPIRASQSSFCVKKTPKNGCHDDEKYIKCNQVRKDAGPTAQNRTS